MCTQLDSEGVLEDAFAGKPGSYEVRKQTPDKSALAGHFDACLDDQQVLHSPLQPFVV